VNRAAVKFSALALHTLAAAVCAFASPHRIQAALEWDSNAEEALRESRAAHNLRFMLHSKKHLRRSSMLFLGALQCGGQFYPDYSLEHKMINELSAGALMQLSPRTRIALESTLRSKTFFRRDIDYVLCRFGPSLTHAFYGMETRAGIEWELLDYFNSRDYDASTPFVTLALGRRVGGNLMVRSCYARASRRFSRESSAGGYQRDRIDRLDFEFDLLWRRLLLNLSLRAERNRSNSYGYSYTRGMILFLFAFELKDFLLRCYGAGGSKRYDDDLLPFAPLELDSEREESNFLILDLSRDLSSGLTILLRAAWYRNESPWAALYYEKTLLNIGFEFRFE